MMFETLVTVWPTPAFARQGQIGLGLTASNTLVAAAVGADGLLYAAFNPLIFGDQCLTSSFPSIPSRR